MRLNENLNNEMRHFQKADSSIILIGTHTRNGKMFPTSKVKRHCVKSREKHDFVNF